MGALNAGGILTKLLGAFSGIASNPYGVAGALILATIIFIGFWTWIKAKYQAWLIAKDAQETQDGKEDFVTHEVQTNTDDTNKDNQGRNALDNIPPPVSTGPTGSEAVPTHLQQQIQNWPAGATGPTGPTA